MIPPRSNSIFWQRDTRSTGTHVDTLADNTPKSRRRVRRLIKQAKASWVGLPAYEYEIDSKRAQEIASQRETHSAISFPV